MKRKLRKALSFSTTMRNPERIAPFLESIQEYNGEVLTNDLIKLVIVKWIKEKLIRADTAMRIKPEYSNIYRDEKQTFTDDQAKDIYELNEKHTKGHKEAGFDKGWPSRFDTYMSLPKEFGFIYYEMDKPIEISETGNLLISTLKPGEDEVVRRPDIFLNSLVKFQTNNPFRSNTVNNAPFVLFLNTIKILENNYDWKKRGIYRHEIPFVTCWGNDDEHELARYINDFRKDYGLKPSNDIVYEKCLELLNTDNRNRFKFKQIVVEGVDDFIRKLRSTGVISLRGRGYLVDINDYEIDKVNYVISKYSVYKEFKDKNDYYAYMSEIDLNIIATHTNIGEDEVLKRKITVLSEWADELDYSDLDKEIKALTGKGSQHPILKFIPEPTRFEFLTSISLKKKYPEYTIKPNYTIDDEGMPTNHALGGVGDIEIYSKNSDVLVEVTLMTNKSQAVNEIPAITRHLGDLAKDNNKTVFAVFVAPRIHEDTDYMIDFTKDRRKLVISAYKNEEFISELSTAGEIIELMR